MIEVHSFLETANGLIEAEDYDAGPVADEDYIEGSLAVAIDGRPLFIKEAVDLVDQLWAYLIAGLEETRAGRPYEVGYPDMPIAIRMTPQGGQVAIQVTGARPDTDETVDANEFRIAMGEAGVRFFTHLRKFVNRRQSACDRNLARLRALLTEAS